MPARAAPLRVLLVEDNEDHAFLSRQALEDEGHTVEWVSTAREAMQHVEKGGFDAAALDYRLPDSSGIQLLQRIRHLRPDLAIVIVTAQGSEEVAVDAMRAGASDYVVKTGAHGPQLVKAVARAAHRAEADRAAREAHKRLQREAETDPLTGLFNRRQFEGLFHHLLQRSRVTRMPIAVAMMDIDRFKQLNDTFGHAVGDEVLVEFAAVLGRCMRKGDLIARYGGDEFVAVMPDIARADAAEVADRIRGAFASSPLAARLRTTLSVSVGIASGGAQEDTDDLLGRADRAMYADKASRLEAAEASRA